MREEYNSILSTPLEAVGRFGQYLYTSETQISARPIYWSIFIRKLLQWHALYVFFNVYTVCVT